LDVIALSPSASSLYGERRPLFEVEAVARDYREDGLVSPAAAARGGRRPCLFLDVAHVARLCLFRRHALLGWVDLGDFVETCVGYQNLVEVLS